MKAKEDFLNGKYEDKNSISTYLDYNKSKDKYIQKLEKQEELSSLRNNIIKNSEADENEITEAKAFQQEFKAVINSKHRAERFRKAELNNSFTSDFLLNVAASSLMYPIMIAVNRQFGIVAKSSPLLKSGILASITMAANCFINAGLAKFLNKKSNS